MSPEQVRGGEIDARADVFAFGALLYEMLSGEPAFRRETGVETLHAVLKEPAPRLVEASLGAAAPVLQRVLDRCLAKAPDDRYESASELLPDLREARRRLTLAPSVPAPARQAPKPKPAPSGPLRVVIVDDEEPARTVLREYLERAGGVEIVGECKNGFEAVKAVTTCGPTCCCSTCRCRSSTASRCSSCWAATCPWCSSRPSTSTRSGPSTCTRSTTC